MTRRSLLSLFGLGFLPRFRTAAVRRVSSDVTLLTAPLELGGTWGGSVPADAAVVIERMRKACLAGVALISDHQPKKLRVDDHSGSTPSIWLHSEDPTAGWIIVIVGTRDWCNLAYQFGHELGHVLCNSWEPDAKPRNPCQWIEEALVEAFSLRGLGLLADGWAHAPPFPNDAAYARDIRRYQDSLLVGCRTAARNQDIAAGFGAWFKGQEAILDEHGDVDTARAAVPTLLGLLESDATMIADLGGLNRWPGRSGVPLHDYLDLWEKSCAALNAPGRLPVRLRELFAGP
ncbi:MAG TPA: hypothetical protein VKU84_17915 [Stellaceae bacterium]|nr:hypothetical protein [Stellaceae bacterium]